MMKTIITFLKEQTNRRKELTKVSVPLSFSQYALDETLGD